MSFNWGDHLGDLRESMTRRGCDLCGGRQVSSLRFLTYRGFPLGPFKVTACCDCREVVFDSAAWSAMRSVDHLMANQSNQLTAPISEGWGLEHEVPGSSQLVAASPTGAGLIDVGADVTPPVRAPDTVRLVTLRALD